MFKFIRRLLFLSILVCLGLYLYRIHENVEQVMEYKPYVQKSLDEHGVEGNNDTELALAIIYTETKGHVSDDVMQSSESVHGQTGMITDEAESIKQGIITLSERLEEANKAGVDVWTGVQSYNYGSAYIDYIAEHGRKNTLELSQSYSRDVLSKSLGNTTGATYRHITPTALIFNGGKLYVNGGNIFYAREVRFNMYLIRVMNWI